LSGVRRVWTGQPSAVAHGSVRDVPQAAAVDAAATACRTTAARRASR